MPQVGIWVEYMYIEEQLGFHSNTGSPYILIQCAQCLTKYVHSPFDFWLTATSDVDKGAERGT